MGVCQIWRWLRTRRGTDLENGIDVNLVRVGETDERGLGRTFLQFSHGSLHGGVLIGWQKRISV